MFRPATGPGFGIKELTAEKPPELFGVGTVGKAKEERVLATAAQRVRPRRSDKPSPSQKKRIVR